MYQFLIFIIVALSAILMILINHSISITRDCDRYKMKLIEYQNIIHNQNELLKNVQKNGNKLRSQSDEERNIMLKALKVAMKHSHPDNNGDPNEFIAYKNLYDDFS